MLAMVKHIQENATQELIQPLEKESVKFIALNLKYNTVRAT